MATTNTTPSPVTRIKQRPAWHVNSLIRRAGSTQHAIGQAVGCSQAMVSKVVLRRIVGTPMAERVWAEIARVVGKAA